MHICHRLLLTWAALVVAGALGWEYRLAGTSATSTSGRLEARSSSAGTWGTVCDDSFGSNDAIVACRSLGLSTSNPSYSTATSSMQGSSSQPTVMDDLACSGTESTLDQCSFTGSSAENCVHAEDIVLSCGGWEYRLTGTGSTSTYGRLEVRPSSLDAWGTVCDDLFGSSDAIVACRSLGLSTANPTYSTASSLLRGASTQPTLLDNLACSGTEDRLDECSYVGSTSEDCSYTEAIVLNCASSASTTTSAPAAASSWEYRLAGFSATSTSGRLEVRPSSTSSWGTVCDDSFGANDALVACRSLGLSTSNPSYSTATALMQGGSTQPIYMDDVSCLGTESLLASCTFTGSTTQNCGHVEDIVLTCAAATSAPTTTTSTTAAATTTVSSTSSSSGSGATPSTTTAAPTAQAWEFRLAGVDATATYGRLEGRASASALWGTVCDFGFGDPDATVACRSLGLSATGATFATAQVAMRGSSSQPIAMDDLRCGGTEANLAACSYIPNSPYCTHSNDVVLTCGAASAATTTTSSSGSGGATTTPPPTTTTTPAPPTPVPPTTSWEYRLVGAFATPTYGRLEARSSSTGTWGTVCDDLFGSSDAIVACRSLGLSSVGATYSTATSSMQGSSTQLIIMDDMNCVGTESTLDACTYNPTHNCLHSEDVVVTCSAAGITQAPPTPPPTPVPATPAPTSTWQFRLAGAFASSTFGRLEAFNPNTFLWGTVCTLGFTSVDAAVACRSLGLSADGAAFGTVSTSMQAASTVPVAMSSLGCTGSEAALDLCPFSLQGAFDGCTRSMDVTVICSAAAATTPAPMTTVFSPGTAPPGGTTAPVATVVGTMWQFRLVTETGALSTSYGRLEVRPSPTDSWGTVCDDLFGTVDARVACRSLGWSDSDAVDYETAPLALRGSGAIYMDDVACIGTEPSLDRCFFRGQFEENCAHSEDVVLACGSQTTTSSSGSQPSTPAPTTAAAATVFEYRLTGGNTTVGRLETRTSSTASWRTVCQTPVFSAGDASVACASLGFSPDLTIASFTTASNAPQFVTTGGASSIDSYPFQVVCGGTEPRLDACPPIDLGSSFSCSHDSDIILSCAVSTWQYRLSGTGATASTGRLEARPGASAPWGTVCGQGFDVLDAAVACRSLGLSAAEAAVRTATFVERGGSLQPIVLANLGCTSVEPQLSRCSYDSSIGSCTHNDDVWLTCGEPIVAWQYRLVGGSSQIAGRLEVRPNTSVPFGTACGVQFTDSNARVACAALGFPRATTTAFFGVAASTEYGRGDPSSPIWLNGIDCTGTEQRPELCPDPTNFKCDHSSDVALACDSRQTTSWEFRVVGGTITSSIAEGRLEVRSSSTATWGTVCNDLFETLDAGVACRSLGIRGDVHRAFFRTVSAAEAGAAVQPITMDDVVCDGRESSLDECTFASTANCEHSEDIWLSCVFPEQNPEPEAVEFRLVGGSSDGQGVLEVRQSASQPWQWVCADGFDSLDATVACRSIGRTDIPASTAQFRTVAVPSTLAAAGAFMAAPVCPAESASLATCGYFSDVSRFACSGVRPAVDLDCNSGQYEYRLFDVGANATSATSGVLQSRANSSLAWGKVCHNVGYSQGTLNAICNSVSGGAYPVGSAEAVAVANMTAIMRNISCATIGVAARIQTSCTFIPVVSSTSAFGGNEDYDSCNATVIRCSQAFPSGALNGDLRLQVSLVGGTRTGQGIPLVRPLGSSLPYGTICRRGVTPIIGSALCRAAGIAVFEDAAVESVSFPGLPIYIGSSRCAASLRSYDECAKSDSYSTCTADDIVAVDCLASSVEFRLANGTENSGRLEFRRSPADANWSTVCSRDFSAVSAAIACRSLGFPADSIASVLPRSAFADGSDDQPIGMDRVNCVGTESKLTLCSYSAAPRDTCTHANDVRLTCGAATGESGCDGPRSCGDWVRIGENVAPNCAALETIRREVGAVSGVDCRTAAVDLAKTRPGTKPAYLLYPRRAACDIYACSFTAATLVPLSLSGTYRLYASVRADANELGFCDRFVSCSGNGEAQLQNVSTLESCTVGVDVDCIDPDGEVAGAPTPGLTNGSALGNNSNVSITPATTGTAPTTRVTGYRTAVRQQCTCSCDAGFFGADCSSEALMTSLSDSMIITYRGTQYSFADHEAIAAATAAILQDPAIERFEMATNAVLEGSMYQDTLRAVSRRGDIAVESAAVLTLLTPALTTQLREVIEAQQPASTVIDMAIPSFVLRSTRTLDWTTGTTLLDGSTQQLVAGIDKLASQNALPSAVQDERVKQMEITLTGVRTSASDAAIRVTSTNFTASCSPSVFGDRTSCNARAECTIRLPNLPLDVALDIATSGLEASCPTRRRQVTNDTGVSASATFTSQARLSSNPPTDTEAKQTPNINLVYLIVAPSVLLLVILIVIGSCIRMTFFRISEGKRLPIAYRIVGALMHFLGVLVLVFYVVVAFTSLDDFRTFEVTAYAFFDEYRSEVCDDSATTALPHRVSYVPADGSCHLMLGYGTSEQLYYGKALCGADGNYQPNAVLVGFAKTLRECREVTMAPIKDSACYPEGDFMRSKAAAEQQFFKVVCQNTSDFARRKQIIEETLDPVAQPRSTVDVSVLPTTDYIFRAGVDAVLYFFVGRWRSIAKLFDFKNDGEYSSSAALATFSEEDVAQGRVGVPVTEVLSGQSNPPPQLRQRSNSPNASSSPMSTLGPLFNGFGSAIATPSDQYGAGAMRYHNVKGTLFDVGSHDVEEGFTVTFWVRASSSSRGFVFLTTDSWVTEDGITPISKRIETILSNPSRDFFDSTWSAYNAIFLDGAAGSVTWLFRNPDNFGGNSDFMTFSDPEVIGTLFDDNWHYVALTSGMKRGRVETQIFIDGRTSYLRFAYRGCMALETKFPAMRGLPATVQVSDADTEIVYPGGVAYVGHLNAGVFGFQVHTKVLEHQVIVALGSKEMASEAAIAVDLSNLTAIVLVALFFFGTLVLLIQGARYFMKKAQAEADGAEMAGGADDSAADNASADNQSGDSMTTFLAMVPLFVTVCQNMSLYFQNWQWPAEFEAIFGWIYFPFSLDFFILPSVPVWVTYGVQFFIAFIALGVVFWLSRSDDASFKENVLVRTKKSQLPEPNTNVEATKVSVMNFDIDGQRVSGFVSRVLVQNEMEACYDDPDRPHPKITSKEAEKEFMTILLEKPFTARVGRCCGTPAYLVDLAQSLDSLTEKLYLCGLTEIDRWPSKQNSLIDALERGKFAKDPSKFNDDTPEGMDAIITAAGEHYTLATTLVRIAPFIIDRAQTLWSVAISEARERRRRTIEDNEGNDDFSVAELGTEITDDDEQNWLLSCLGESDDFITAINDAAEIDRQLSQQDSAGALKVWALELSAASAATSKKHEVRSILAAAKGAEYHMQPPVLQTDTEGENDAAVLQQLVSPSPVLCRALHALYVLMNPSQYSNVDQVSACKQDEVAQEIGEKLFEMLRQRLFGARQERSGILQLIQNSQLITGYIRTSTTEAEDGSLRLSFFAVPKDELQRAIDFAEQSVRETDETAQEGAVEMQIEVDIQVLRCPVHQQRLIAATDDHLTVRSGGPEKKKRRDPNVYRCASKDNHVYSYERAKLELQEMKEEERPSGTDDVRAYLSSFDVSPLCDTADFLVCQNDTCNFSICNSCTHLSRYNQGRSWLNRRAYIARRNTGSALFMILAEAMYQPAVKSAIVTVFCHASLACHFPTCYNPVYPDFLTLSVGSALILFSFGFGFVWFLFVLTFSRKRAILDARVLEFATPKQERDFYENNEKRVSEGKKQLPLPVATVHRGAPCCGNEAEYNSYGASSALDVFRVGVLDSEFEELLSRDRSMFKSLYDAYSFRWMLVHPVTFAFKVALLLVVLYIGEPNSLRLVVGCAAVEAFQLLFFMISSPFTNFWINVMQQAGSLHQVAQLGLMCIHRAATYLDPTDTRATRGMIAVATVYLVIVLLILIFVVILPAVLSWWRRRKEKQKQRDEAKEAMNQTIGPSGGGDASFRGDMSMSADDGSLMQQQSMSATMSTRSRLRAFQAATFFMTLQGDERNRARQTKTAAPTSSAAVPDQSDADDGVGAFADDEEFVQVAPKRSVHPNDDDLGDDDGDAPPPPEESPADHHNDDDGSPAKLGDGGHELAVHHSDPDDVEDELDGDGDDAPAGRQTVAVKGADDDEDDDER